MALLNAGRRALPKLLGQTQQFALFATKEVAPAKKDWSAVTIPADTKNAIPTTVGGGQVRRAWAV